MIASLTNSKLCQAVRVLDCTQCRISLNLFTAQQRTLAPNGFHTPWVRFKRDVTLQLLCLSVQSIFNSGRKKMELPLRSGADWYIANAFFAHVSLFPWIRTYPAEFIWQRKQHWQLLVHMTWDMGKNSNKQIRWKLKVKSHKRNVGVKT